MQRFKTIIAASSMESLNVNSYLLTNVACCCYIKHTKSKGNPVLFCSTYSLGAENFPALAAAERGLGSSVAGPQFPRILSPCHPSLG